MNRIHVNGDYVQEEAVAGEAGIYPGMLCKLNSSGELIKHADAGGVLGDEVLIALEDALQGNLISTVYTSGDVATYMIPQKGTQFYGYVAAGPGTAIIIGDKMISNGAGFFKETTGTPAATPAVAMEAQDQSASAAVAVHVKMRAC